jgi:hypothetical protein
MKARLLLFRVRELETQPDFEDRRLLIKFEVLQLTKRLKLPTPERDDPLNQCSNLRDALLLPVHLFFCTVLMSRLASTSKAILYLKARNRCPSAEIAEAAACDRISAEEGLFLGELMAGYAHRISR